MHAIPELLDDRFALKSNRTLRRFVWLSSAGIVVQAVMLTAAAFAPESRLTVLSIYLLPLIPFSVAVVGIEVGRLGGITASKLRLVSGFAVIVGGACFDLFSTLWHSPDLTEEANLPLRILLDSQHSLPFVYGYGLLVNVLFTGLFCILWWTLLRHRSLIVEAVQRQNPRTLQDFLKAATGAGHLTLRQWLWPLKPSELPLLYFWIWPTVMTVIWSATILRWYAGLEWFDVIPPSIAGRAAVMGGTGLLVLGLYFEAIRRQYSSARLVAEPNDSPPA